MKEEIEMVKLKNGSEEAKGLVAVTMLSLKDLIKRNPIVFYELVCKCRDREHVFFGNAAQELRECGMVQGDNSIHDSIKNIVLSATTGEGLGMILTNPI